MLVHIIWWSIPVCLLLMSLFSWLEGRKDPMRKDEAGDLFRNALFVTGCIGISYLVEWYLLGFFVDLSGGWIPLGFLQTLTLPCVLWLGASFVGPSMAIRIPAQTSGRQRPQKRRR